MFNQGREINYLKLTFVVCGGVLLAGLVGFLFSLLVLDAATDATIESIESQTQAATQRMEKISDDAAQRAETQRKQQRRAVELQRLNSKTGKDLARRCEEFRSFYQESHGSYAREERDKACRKFEIYIETGQVR